MSIGYNKVLAIIFLALGGFNVVVNAITHGTPIAFFSGGMSLLIGALYLSRTYFIVEPDRITVKALLGPLTRTYEFSSYSDLVVENGGRSVYVREGSDMRKIRVSRWLSNGSDWDRFVAEIGS
ncbi:MAG TPA: hypothetical protein VHI13_15635 [Candidatus Kapabacteria bacterium]|nr:hypothetical protein [Candidatus Kapabacteria bacterium]